MAYQAPKASPLKPASPAPSPKSGSKSESGSWLKGFITLIIVIIIIGGGIYLAADFIGISSPFTGNAVKELEADWQAVFLTNGQVYFGKIGSIDNQTVVLTNIYYLQVVDQPLQRSQESGETAPTQPEQRLTLIKLGNEIHGPRDEIVINRDHVIIIEDLKDDSRVVQSINDYVTNQQAEPIE